MQLDTFYPEVCRQCSKMRQYKILVAIVFVNLIVHFVFGDETYFVRPGKTIQRVSRSNSNKNSNIDEMGKFFMKASKSVPRIGRGNNNYEYGQNINKRNPAPIWNEIADRFEYDPEFMTSPQFLQALEMADDPSAYNWDQMRNKRENNPKHHPKYQYFM